MPGGARPGAGRKPGVVETRPRRTLARKLAEQAAGEGILPADIMLRSARHHWAKAIDKRGKVKDEAEARRAVEYAEKAAPYFNAKLATVQHTGRNGGPIETVDLTKLSGAELEAYAQLNIKLLGIDPSVRS